PRDPSCSCLLQPAPQLAGLLPIVTTDGSVRLKRCAPGRPPRLIEYSTQIPLGQMQPSLTGGLATGHARNRRTDGGSNTAGTTTRAALHGYESHRVFKQASDSTRPTISFASFVISAGGLPRSGVAAHPELTHQLL